MSDVVSQIREELLAPMERERLITRESLKDAKNRATNDLRVRKKLIAWLKNVPDVLLILEKLPKEQTASVLSDEDVYKLLKLTEETIRVREFTPIEGRIVWPKWVSQKGEATDLDIWRSLKLYRHVNRLVKDFFGRRNPLADWEVLVQMEKTEGFRERISPEEKRGMDRIRHAIETFSKEESA